MSRVHSRVLIAAAVASLASPVVTAESGGQGFHFVEESFRLPADTNTGSSTTDVDLVDVDGDGDLDVYLTEGTAGFDGRPDRLLINQGHNSGTFVDESATRLLPRSAANSTKTAFGDLDGDGDVDALVANVLGEDLLINNGSGVFTLTNAHLPPPVVIPPTRFDISADVALADVDNDGDLDAILANENPFPGSTGDQSRLWLNNGSGVFTDATNLLPQRIEQTIGILTGDIDGDGDLDIIALNRTTPPPGSGTGGQDRVYINQINLGHGFVDETATRIPVGNDHSRGGSLADLNGDGALDLVVGNSMTQPVSLYFNNGTGVFIAGDFGMVPEDRRDHYRLRHGGPRRRRRSRRLPAQCRERSSAVMASTASRIVISGTTATASSRIGPAPISICRATRPPPRPSATSMAMAISTWWSATRTTQHQEPGPSACSYRCTTDTGP